MGPVTPPGPTPSSTVYDVRSYDAPGTGGRTAAAGITAAFDAAKAAGGGLVFLPEGVYLIDTASGLEWTTGKVALVGTGAGSVLKAGSAATAQVLKVAVGGGGGGRFSDLLVTANGIATHAIVQTIPTETSVQTTFERVIAKGAKSYQWVNLRCEDCLYVHCVTPGDEGTPATVPRSFTWDIPHGACTVVGGTLFGLNAVNAQLLSVQGATIGPFLIQNTTPSDAVLELAGCYVYDGGVTTQHCIGTNGTLATVTATGCVFVAQRQTIFVNGNIPATATLRFTACTWVQGAATGTTITLVSASGGGSLVLDGGNVVTDGATTVHAFAKVSTPTTVFSMPVAVKGVTVTPGASIRTTNSTLDDGSGDLTTGGQIQAGGAGIKLWNSGRLEFLNAGGGSIYSGSGAPAATLGVTGDLYIRTAGLATADTHLYTKEASAGWVGVA